MPEGLAVVTRDWVRDAQLKPQRPAEADYLPQPLQGAAERWQQREADKQAAPAAAAAEQAPPAIFSSARRGLVLVTYNVW